MADGGHRKPTTPKNISNVYWLRITFLQLTAKLLNVIANSIVGIRQHRLQKSSLHRKFNCANRIPRQLLRGSETIIATKYKPGYNVRYNL